MVISNPIFEHCRKHFAKIEKAKRLLRSEGYVVINIENEKKRTTQESN